VNRKIEDLPCDTRQSVSVGTIFTSPVIVRANYLQSASLNTA